MNSLCVMVSNSPVNAVRLGSLLMREFILSFLSSLYLINFCSILAFTFCCPYWRVIWNNIIAALLPLVSSNRRGGVGHCSALCAMVSGIPRL